MQSNSMIQSLEVRRFLTVVSGIVFADTVKVNNAPDPGEGMPNCVVTFNNNADHSVSTPTTAADGSFSTDLLPGTYDLSVDGPNVGQPYHVPAFVVGTSPIKLNPIVKTESQVNGGGGGGTKAPVTDFAVSVTPTAGSFVQTVKPVTASVVIQNKADGFTGNITATLYFSSDKIIDSTDAHLAPIKLTGITVKKGKTYSVPFNPAALANKLPAGLYYLAVKISATGDKNAANDTAFSKTPIALDAPITALTPVVGAKVDISKNHDFPFVAKLLNAGNFAATGTVTYALFARPTTGNDIPLSTGAAAPFVLKIKASANTGQRLVSVRGLSAGSYQLIIKGNISVTSPIHVKTTSTVTGATFVVK